MKLLKQIETLFGPGTAAGLTDAQLLERFHQRRDDSAESAFAALVDRHGAMVLRVCRQVLGDDHHSQDASQATFLVLARRAGSIGRRESVASWLYGVALRVAAKARVAAARRRAHERRGGEIMAARQAAGVAIEEATDPDRWAKLHDELGRLPESFREPLILCHLEGLTQEQAAAQLRCPLGTIQSRLARGRAKLKARLDKQGIDFSAALLGAASGGRPFSAAPEAWSEATVRLALEFAHGNGPAIAVAGASAALAEEVLRAMLLTKLKVAIGSLYLAALLVSGAGAWARHEWKAVNAPLPAIEAAKLKEQPDPVPQQAPARSGFVERTVRGIVRDEQGRPVAKAWFGWEVNRSPDLSRVVLAPDQIRERQEPFRDESGKIVPPGVLGKHFELRDKDGTWRPVHPADVRRYQKPPSWHGFPHPSTLELSAAVEDALTSGRPVFEVRVANGHWQMEKIPTQSSAVMRTDAEGHFRSEFRVSDSLSLHFASPDFTRRAYHIAGPDDPDTALEITLKPVRKVHARVVFPAKDHPVEGLAYDIYTVDPAIAGLYEIPAIGQKGGHWENGGLEMPAEGSSPSERPGLDVRLIPGRYKVRFMSDTVYRVVDLVVPPGDGPIELPDIHLETFVWVNMLGKPAAEIAAVDVNGQPVKLADYRGKVVILSFWSDSGEPYVQSVRQLCEIQNQFKTKPLSILAVHDASLTSLAQFQRAVADLRNRVPGEIPIRLLLDAALLGAGRFPPCRAGEAESGRTRDIYDICGPTTFVIDKSGRMSAAATPDPGIDISAFTIDKMGALVREPADEEPEEDDIQGTAVPRAVVQRAVEDQLGLPRSPTQAEWTVLGPKGEVVVKGKVVDPEGRAVPGADVQYYDANGRKELKTGPSGDFRFKLDDARIFASLSVAAPGLASREFHLAFERSGKKSRWARGHVLIERTGLIPEPLQMTRGAAVIGRVVRDGEPLAGVTFLLNHREYADKELACTTDERGVFRFPHVRPKSDFWIAAALGSLGDQGALSPQRIQTQEDHSTLDLGDLHVQEGRNLAGRMVCADDKSVPRGTRVELSVPNGRGTLNAEVDDKGRFEIRGIPGGAVSLRLALAQDASTTLYHFSSKNKCLDPDDPGFVRGQVDRDITNLTILLEPGQEPQPPSLVEIDPTVRADFTEASVGSITGVPPGDYPRK